MSLNSSDKPWSFDAPELGGVLKQLLLAIVVLALLLLSLFFFAEVIVDALAVPFEVARERVGADDLKFIYVAPQEAFFMQFKVAFYPAVFLFYIFALAQYRSATSAETSPIRSFVFSPVLLLSALLVVGMLWDHSSFLLFAVLSHALAAVLIALFLLTIWSVRVHLVPRFGTYTMYALPLLFWLGAAFAYLIWIPKKLEFWFVPFLAAEAKSAATNNLPVMPPRISEYFDVVFADLVFFGMLFQLPLLVLAYAISLSNKKMMRKKQMSRGTV